MSDGRRQRLRRARLAPGRGVPCKGYRAMAPRAYWKGHVRLSLVAFPVQLFSAATAGSRVSFHQIHRPSGQRVRYQKTVPGVGPVDKDEIVKGYEVAKDSYVTFADDELEAIRIESQHTIDLVSSSAPARSTRSTTRSPTSWCRTARW